MIIKRKDKDKLIEKIKELYQNYGIDTSDMDDDELARLKDLYKKKGKDIDLDLENSKKFRERFADDIV